MNITGIGSQDFFMNQISQMAVTPNQVQGQEQFNFPSNEDEKIGSLQNLPNTTSFDSLMQVGRYNPDMMVDSSTMEVSESESTDSDLMSQLSDTFRANADSIEQAMDELGLTLEDLSDKDNLSALADAMNEGAENLGLPTVDNLDEAVDGLYESITGTSESEEEAATDSGSTGGSSSSEEDETTTEIVMINGVPFLETTTTTNGVETTTRTPLGFGNERPNISFANNIA